MKKLRLPHLFLFLAGLCGACGSHTETADPAETARQDSLALKVALMPTLDCLPFYYADRCGIFKDPRSTACHSITPTVAAYSKT